MQEQSFGWREVIFAVLVLAVAAGIRVGYVMTCMNKPDEPPPFQVQDQETAITLVHDKEKAAQRPNDREQLAENIAKRYWFGSDAPLLVGKRGKQETTAHVAPGYPSLVGYLQSFLDDPVKTNQIILWTQCALGALTALFYFLFARIAFNNSFVGLLAGLLTALHPFWIANTAELQDGTLTSFLLAACLYLGTLSAEGGNPVSSLVFGGALAGLALVRAALLPYSFIACLWFLLRCRKLESGWIGGVLAFLAFAGGLTAWTVRNWQEFEQVVPVADSMFVDLWEGNNDKAWGGPEDEKMLAESLPEDRLPVLLNEKNQVRRYSMLSEDVWHSVQKDPARTVKNRLRSGVSFVFGAEWIKDSQLWRTTKRDDISDWVIEAYPIALPAMLLALLVLGLLGWRWSCGWDPRVSLASLAMLFIPLPYILSHAEHFSGPRLPLDGVLLCYTAFLLVWIVPGACCSPRRSELP